MEMMSQIIIVADEIKYTFLVDEDHIEIFKECFKFSNNVEELIKQIDFMGVYYQYKHVEPLYDGKLVENPPKQNPTKASKAAVKLGRS